jgi:hypothetical protein
VGAVKGRGEDQAVAGIKRPDVGPHAVEEQLGAQAAPAEETRTQGGISFRILNRACRKVDQYGR